MSLLLSRLSRLGSSSLKPIRIPSRKLYPHFASCMTFSDAAYDHRQLERKWQDHWDQAGVFKSVRRPGREKKYVLDMFPYPSGEGLHVGHPEGYTATDIMARYWRMRGFDVLHPMGWDSFGLPAEQHAINTGTHPAVTTGKNIATFKRQLKSLGFSYDWSRELATTDERYMRWTQWIFLQLFRRGLASQGEAMVNWCPELGTVLANEEIIDGKSERGAFPVVRQPLRQWILHITKYAEELEQGLSGLSWPDSTMAMQKQWIGRSVGASIVFAVEGHPGAAVEVFTTRPDTLLGVSYVVLAPENPLVRQIVTPECSEAVSAYVREVAGKSDLERTSTGKDRGKTGAATGAFARHPFTGERLPVWVADYVLAGYGTGCVMAVPAHDERDFQFAQQFGLPVRPVVAPAGGAKNGPPVLPFCEAGVLCNSGAGLDGLSSADGQTAIVARLQAAGAGAAKVSYKLRDWVFSRQRYWGEPIPIYFPVRMLTADGKGSPLDGSAYEIDYNTPIAVDESELPLRLPPMDDFKPGTDPSGCLARALDWRFFQRDGRWFARETNTMPQWAGSCWYYLRFTDPHNDGALFGAAAASWLPVDLYVGGQEHAVLHLLYARFWHRVLFDLGVVDHAEPFTKLVHQGMILGTDGEKMSKSRGNVVNPDDVIREHGADALRLYEMFMGPLEASKPWQTSQLSGVVRFRDRVFSLLGDIAPAASLGETRFRELNSLVHRTVKGVTSDVDRMAFNTAISKLMVLTNALKELKGGVPREAVETVLLLVAPFAPHLAEECWQRLGHPASLAHAPWPEFDEALCTEVRSVVSIQINGKMRGTVEAAADVPEDQVLALVQAVPGAAKYLSNVRVQKVIYIPGKTISIIVK